MTGTNGPVVFVASFYRLSSVSNRYYIVTGIKYNPNHLMRAMGSKDLEKCIMIIRISICNMYELCHSYGHQRLLD